MNTNHEFAIQRISNEYELLQSSKEDKKYTLLYKAIKRCIRKRELPDQWLLPPTRILSISMALSRTTVLKSYE
ncbi:MAG: DNA-binding GntR family transcriptional regulator, partial [Nonlabens sp.]